MKIVRIGILLSLALGLGCAHSQGEVLVSVVSTAAWHTHVAELKPGFSSTGEQALTKVLPTTRVVRQSDALGASTARSTAIAIGNDTQATAPEVDAPPIELGGVSAPSEGLGGFDPFLVYGSATALHQEVAMLNRYIEDAATRRNAIPYLVRLQITHMPNRPNRPVDTYVTLRFGGNDANGKDFPDVDESDRQGVLVLPLLATESLESSVVEKTFELQLAAELARQVSVAPFKAGKQVPSISVAAAQKLRAAYKRARSSLGRDLNTTFLVGAEDSNIIKVRIGAANAGSKDLQMVPRNHYLSILVMVPTESLKDGGYLPIFPMGQFECKAETSPHDPDAAAACETYEPKPPGTNPAWDHWSLSVTPTIEYRRRQSRTNTSDPILGTPTDVSLPPWWNFHMALCQPGWQGRFAGMDHFKGCMFGEPVTLLDDGKKTEIVVPGVKTASPESLSVVVYTRDGCGDARDEFFPIRSTQVTWSRSASLVRATFPSLSKIARASKSGQAEKSSLTEKNEKTERSSQTQKSGSNETTTTTEKVSKAEKSTEKSTQSQATKCPNLATGADYEVPDYLAVLYAGEPRWDQSQFDGNDPLRNIVLMDRVRYRRIAEAPPEFPVEVAHGANHLVIDEDGRGYAIVVIGKAETASKQPKEILITVEGADLASATLQEAPGGSAQLAEKGAALSLAKPGTWRLEFANASPNQPITITLAAGGAKTKWDYEIQRNPTARTPAR